MPRHARPSRKLLRIVNSMFAPDRMRRDNPPQEKRPPAVQPAETGVKAKSDGSTYDRGSGDAS
jgi:hypothetical protein